MELYVLDPALALVGVMERFQRASWARRFSRPGSLEVIVNKNAVGVAELAIGAFVALDDDSDGITDRAYRIEQLEIELDEDGRSSEFLTVRGRDVSGLLADRSCIPPIGQSHDEQIDVPAETSMKHYVDEHAGPSAAAERRIPDLVIAADAAQGALDSEAGRYQPISEILENISLRAGMGYDVSFDPGPREHIFDVIPGVDRSAEVFLDVEFDTVRGQRWLRSELSRKTFAIVAGQGEGSARTIVEAYPGVEPTGFDRREIFVDSRDTDDTDLLEQRGLAKLAETKSADTFETDIAQFGSFRYLEHFDLGDIVTVRNEAWGIEQPIRVVTATSTMTPETGLRSIVVELGQPSPTLKDRVTPSGLDGSARE